MLNVDPRHRSLSPVFVIVHLESHEEAYEEALHREERLVQTRGGGPVQRGWVVLWTHGVMELVGLTVRSARSGEAKERQRKEKVALCQTSRCIGGTPYLLVMYMVTIIVILAREQLVWFEHEKLPT
jgi:hypothetical protein